MNPERETTDELLLALCAGDFGTAAQARIVGLLAQPVDWPRLGELAALHGVVGLARRRLAALQLQPTVPPDTWQAIDAAATQIAVDGMLALRETASMAAALDEAGIQPLLLKGQALADLLYDDPVIRPASDIDLLVERGEIEAAQRALAAIGYRPRSADWLRYQLAHGYHISLAREVWPGRAVLLELHWDLGGRGLFRYDLAAWRSRTETFMLSGVFAPLQRFAPDDQLLHLALHMRKHRYMGLRWLVDVAALLSRFRDTLDWLYLTGTARQAGLATLLHTSLALAQRLLAAPVDAAALARLEPAAWRRKLIRSMLTDEALLAPLERQDAGWTRLAPVEVVLIDRPAAMTRELARRLLPPPEATFGADMPRMSRGQRLAFQARRLLHRGATMVE